MKLPKYIISFCLLICIICSVNSLYEDQAGTFDWLVQFMGQPKSISFIQDGDSNKKIIVSTEQNVLALINAKNGVLGWRQVFEQSELGRIDDVKLIGQRVVAVFGGGQRVRLLQGSSGVVEWETHIPNSDPQYISQVFIQAGSVGVLTARDLSVLSLETGTIKSSYTLKEGQVVGMGAQSGGGIAVVTKDSSSIVTMTTYSNNKASSVQLGTLWSTQAECILSGGGSVVCMDQGTSKLFSTSLSSTKPFNTLPLTTVMKGAKFLKLESTAKSGLDLLALKVNEHTTHLYSLADGLMQLKFTFKEALAVQSFIHQGHVVIAVLTRLNSDKLQLEVHSEHDNKHISTHLLPFPNHHGNPLQMHEVGLVGDSKGNMVASMLLLCQDHSMVFLEKSGKHSWTREESLASIISSQLLDLPISQSQGAIKEEFSSGENIFEMFYKRITSQFCQLKTFVEHLKQLLKNKLFPVHHHHHHHHQGHNEAVEEDDEDEDEDDGVKEDLSRDEFNLNKIIVAVTSVGKLFGIDASTGRTVWKLMIKDLAPFTLPYHQNTLPLITQRTSSHFPHPPICTLIGLNKVTGKQLIFSFHPINGIPTLLSSSSSASSSLVAGEELGYSVETMVTVEQMTADFIHPLLLIDSHLNVHVYPPNATSHVHQLSHSLHSFKIDPSSNTATGYKVVSRGQQLVATPTWSLQPPHNISATYAKHPSEHVHSVGLPLEDRSVLYKYLNPNLIVMVTKEDVPKYNPLKGSFTIYLVDAVSGSVVFQCSHKKSAGAVHVVHSENWVVYNYWNLKHRRNELAVLELYEGTHQTNSTAFSSLHPPPLPIVLRQAYIFGGYISSMGVSLTEKGITSKELLFALETGGVVGLPKMLVDARRPEVVSQESREEGLIPYMPELPRPWERMLNYHLEVRNIREVTTSPSGLESTSLVFCYGLDLFYTRLMPSKMFDVLKEDFDYLFISSVLAGMLITSLLTQKLASNKLLNRAWK